MIHRRIFDIPKFIAKKPEGIDADDWIVEILSELEDKVSEILDNQYIPNRNDKINQLAIFAKKNNMPLLATKILTKNLTNEEIKSLAIDIHNYVLEERDIVSRQN